MVTTSRDQLRDLLSKELGEAAIEERELYERVAISPTRWKQSPWGDDSGGFWAVAVLAKHVLWYNEIEGGFNVSGFSENGVIPENEYWCNQDHVAPALRRLVEEAQAESV